MSDANRRWQRLVAGLVAMCVIVVLLEWGRPGLGNTPPDERRDATALFYTELQID